MQDFLEKNRILISLSTTRKMISFCLVFAYFFGNIHYAVAVGNSMTEPWDTLPTAKRRPADCSCPEMATFSKSVWSGSIKSPKYPSYYCASLSCMWVIKRGEPGTGIRLHFETFETEYGADYLDVFFVGEKEVLHKLTRLTGSVESPLLPNYVINSDGGFELILKTDSTSQRAGFLAHFERFNLTSDTCGCPEFLYTATSQGITVTSPNYPRPYCHNLQCYYLIRARPLHSVQIGFDEFELENRYDSVAIFDGDTGENTISSTKMAVLNGTHGLNREFTSHQNSMMLVFRSDGDTNHRGFKATVKEVDGPCRCINRTMTASEGNFSSPGFPTGYCGTLNCTYSIEVESTKVVQLEFPVFRLLTGDSVFVEANDDSGLPIMKWRGTYSYANFRFTSNSNRLKLRMVTSAGGGSVGFNASYKAISRAGCACPHDGHKIVGGLEGHLSLEACGPLDCFYLLPHPGNDFNLLTIWVDQIKIHPAKDWFRIYKGKFSLLGYPESVRTFSGQVANHSAIGISVDNSQEIMLYFHSEEAHSDKDSGFKIRYRWASQVCSCGMLTLSANSDPQILTSPGYPVPYCNSLNCKWKIRAASGHRIVINITDLMTEPSDTDNLGVYEGLTTNMETRLHLYKGDLDTGLVPPITKSAGNVVTVWFTTDRSVVFRGWSLSYYSEPTTISDTSSTTKSNESSEYVPVDKPGYRIPQQRIVVNTLPQSSMGWSFATGVFLGILISIFVFGLILLIKRTGRCHRWKSNSSVAYVRYPQNGNHMVNEGIHELRHITKNSVKNIQQKSELPVCDLLCS